MSLAYMSSVCIFSEESNQDKGTQVCPNFWLLVYDAMMLWQAWPVLTVALLRRPLTVPLRSVGGRSEATGQQHHGGEARTATALAARLLIRWDHRLLVALAGQAVVPEPRAPTAAGELRRLYPLKINPARAAFFLINTIFLHLFSFVALRYKGRRPECHAPHVPNQPSEAAAHFYFELAKTVLIKAGGNSSTSIFTQPSASGGHQGPHRNLHICAFEIGLYALGLHNFVSPNWLSRTYSSHVSWITGEQEVSVKNMGHIIRHGSGKLPKNFDWFYIYED